MAYQFIFPMRIASIILALVELALTAYIVNYSDDYFYEDPYGDWGVNHSTPSQIAFLLFASIFSLLTLVYLVLAPIFLITGGDTAPHTRNRVHKIAILGLDSVIAVFWLAGWIALAKLIGGPSTCSTFCAAIQACVAFAAFLWAAFSVVALAEIWEAWKTKKEGNGKVVGHTAFA